MANNTQETKNKGRHTVSDVKKKIVDDMIQRMDKSPIVGVVNMENLPARQLSNMRSQLRGKVELIMTKKRLIKIALGKSKKTNIKDLEKYLKGMPALLLTDENPFSLFKLLKKRRSNAPIKAGQKSPKEITVHAGATNFSPGPVIGELGSFKIKAGIEAGKVIIKEDRIVAKEGDVIDDKLSSLLLRLGIEPMEIGLALVAVYEKGEILDSKVLDIDEEAYMNNLRLAASESFNLAMFVALPIKETMQPLLAKAYREAKAVAKEANILTSDTIGETLALADAQMLALKDKLNI
jgi:large subunit ribosomal protein L10